jgi:N-methylhydantoinase A
LTKSSLPLSGALLNGWISAMNAITENTGKYQIAVDVGGTFTDGALLDTNNDQIVLGKALTTYADPGEAIFSVIASMIEQMDGSNVGFSPSQVNRIVHGTTLITNTLIERNGVKTALLTTQGMIDCLDIRRELRYATYDLFLEYPEPLVSRADRFEVTERLGPNGQEWTALDEQSVRDAANAISGGDYEAVAICFLHSSVDDKHEVRAAEIIHEMLPNISVSISSKVAREIGEYERMSTVVANAYVQPTVEHYLGLLVDKFDALKLDATLDVMVSNGAFTTADLAARYPIRLLESGPAGGVLSAINCAMNENYDNILAFDMGGTTAKACVAINNEPAITHVFEFGRVRRFRRGSGLPAVAPSIDLIEIGAGGGSIASLNELGLLNVGPESAGSEPGPACYGLGGTGATVTDADVHLGYLDPTEFLGGKMQLDPAAGEKALATIGGKVGLSATKTALGIHDIVNENMAAAARTHIAEKGLDVRDFVMVATGGAGPVHAVDVARRLRISKIVCPIASGVGSCLGFLAAPARSDMSWSRVERLDQLDRTEYQGQLDSVQQGIVSDLAACGISRSDIRWRLSAEIRYVGQGACVDVVISESTISPYNAATTTRKFEESYIKLFGNVVPGGVAEVVTWRLTGESDKHLRRYKLATQQEHSQAPYGMRRIYLPDVEDYAEVPVYARNNLPANTLLEGPLILTEPESTLVVAYPSRVSILSSLAVEVELSEISA